MLPTYYNGEQYGTGIRPGGYSASYEPNWMDYGQFGLGALSTLGSLYFAYKQNRLQQDAFDFNKNLQITKLNNAATAYNNSWDQRQNSIGAFNNLSTEQVQANKDAGHVSGM